MSEHEGEPALDANRIGGPEPDERLSELEAELFKSFGKLTRWKWLCQERDVTTTGGKIRLAEEVLAADSTGTVAEWYVYHLRLRGKESFDIDEVLAGQRR